MKNRVGQQFGNYRLVRSLGRGGFAEVYLGEHLYLKNHAALKVLHTQLADKDIDQFLTEAQTLAHLTHPNIVRVLEFAVDQDGTAFLVTEYVPRGTLRKRHPQGLCLSLETTASYVKQIASALQYAHNQKLIHRDVKPENVLLGLGQNVLLSDFGLSLFSPSDKKLEVPGLAGTLPYMAPELFYGRPEFASDQYALGVMAYEWLCGKRPFQGGVVAIQYQHVHVPPPPLRDRDPSLSQEIEGVVLKALAKDPKQRFASMQRFAQAFEQACQISSTSSYIDQTAASLNPNRALTPVTPTRIFILSAQDDKAFAVRLAKDMQIRGIVARNEHFGGATEHSEQEKEVRRAIRAADLILLIISAAAQSAPIIQNYLRVVSQYQRRLVCIQTTDIAPSSVLPQDWTETTQINVVNASKRPYERILDEVLSCLEHEIAEEGPVLPELVGEPRSPYKGLRAFTQVDAIDFFGRDHLVEELVNRARELAQPDVPQARLLAAIGPSGSGKSSVIMAGLLPRLQQNALPGSKDWVYLRPMVPGVHPLEALTLTLASHLPSDSIPYQRQELMHEAAYGLHRLASRVVQGQGRKLVLFIDQFEEVFTLTTSERERQHFINLLVTAATEMQGPVIVLLTLRADFYHRCMAYPRLHRLIENHQKSVLPVEAADLRAVIKGPAALPDVQVAFEGNLVSDLLFEVQEQAGALPLLQFTLEQLFLRRKERLLTLQAYREIGGVKGALVRHAEATYAALPSEEHRHLARMLFLRLIDPGQTEQDTTRRRAAIPELLLPDQRQTTLLYKTAESFIAARLLTTNEISGTTTIEISHEALIREWKRLADWLDGAHQEIRLQQTISADVAEWQRRGQPDDLLYRGDLLAEAEEWLTHETASADEATFIRASTARNQAVESAERLRQAREQDLHRRAESRRRYVIGLMGVTSIIVIVALIVGLVLQTQLLNSQMQLLNSLPVAVTNLSDQGRGSLRYAIDHAQPGDAITFSSNLKGTIVLTHSELRINKNLTISGPGASRLFINGRNVSRVFHIGKGFFVTLSNLTVENGQTHGSEGGAGIENDGSLVVTNCSIVNNTTDNRGDGGGILNHGTLQLVGSNVLSNSADMGGGILNFGTLIINNSTISKNSASSLGGGISIRSGQATISRSTISDNTAYGNGFGGGISSGTVDLGGVFTLIDSTISGNKASSGGGIWDDGGANSITTSTISDNSSSEQGGGIDGGYNDTIVFSTIYNNIVKNGKGGGINSGGQISLWGCIVAGNSANSGPDISGKASIFSTNLIQDTSGLTPVLELGAGDPSIISKPPLLGPLQKNGGPTQTHTLLAGSPAIDQVPPGYYMAALCNTMNPITDQRGVTRPQGKGCDLGAYEYEPSK